MLADHVIRWQTMLHTVVPGATLEFLVSALQPTEANRRILASTETLLAQRGGAAALTIDQSRTRGAGYYDGVALRIELDGEEVGDGGLTDWTALLTADAKERCLISGVASERVVARMAESNT